MPAQPAPKPTAQISLDNGAIKVDPMKVEVDQNDFLTWNILGAQPRDKIRIEFESKNCQSKKPAPKQNLARRRGPFARRPSPTPENPQEGVYQREGQGSIESTEAECLDEWKYTVFWERAGAKIDPLDPFVIVRTGI